MYIHSTLDYCPGIRTNSFDKQRIANPVVLLMRPRLVEVFLHSMPGGGVSY